MSSVKWTLEQALKEEVRDYLGYERYERRLVPQRPAATRRGTYTREWWTRYGCIFDLRVPKLRRGNPDLHWQSIERYERCWGPFLDQQLWHYALGHSLRDLQEAMHLTLGAVLSLEVCNRLVLGRKERAHAFQTARREHPPPLVVVDGLWRKLAGPTGEVKSDRWGRQRPVKPQKTRVMLTAVGLWEDGHWEILPWQLAPGEDAASWGTLLGTLYRKGITEATTHLIISDGAQGLDKALYTPRWGVPPQRCLFHKIKNIADHLPYPALGRNDTETSSAPCRQSKQDDKQAILADAGQISSPDIEGEIRARAKAFEAKWAEREPKAVAVFMNGFALTVSYVAVDCPRAHVSLLRTMNLLERFHKDLRRKPRDIGLFQSQTGGEVFWFLMAMRETAKQRAICRGSG